MDVEIKLSEKGVIVRGEDFQNAKIRDEEIKAAASKSIEEINSSIANLERDVKTMSTHLENLKQERMDCSDKDVSQKFLELLEKEIAIVQEKIDIDYEQIETYKDRIEVLRDQSKAHDEIVVLLRSILGLEEILLTSHEHAPIVKKESEIAKNYITAVQASIKEKESVIVFFTNRLEEIKLKVSEDERKLATYLGSLKMEMVDTGHVNPLQEKIESILLWKKAIGAQWIAIFETRLGTSKIRYDKTLMELKNAEFNAAFLAEKAKRLEEKMKTEELAKKQEALDAAEKAEEESQKIAESTKAEVERTLQETARKSVEIAQEQLKTTSPEKKRVLELEAEMHKQVGLVAKRKDELITEGSQRYKDFTEYKKLEAEIGLLLTREETIKEIDASLKNIEVDIKRFSESIAALESLTPSLKEEKKLLSENLATLKEELAKVQKEASSFTDKGLEHQTKEYANQILNAIKEQTGLLATRLDRLQERWEIKKNALALLEETKQKLITLKAANVWMRVESTISFQTLQSVFKDFLDCYNRRDSYYNIILTSLKNFISYLSREKHTAALWLKFCGLLGLIAVWHFSKRYIHQWSTLKIQTLYESTDASYSKTRLSPSLFLVLQKSINAIWLAVLSASIPGILGIKAPVITGIIYILLFYAVYRILRHLLFESFSPEKGDRKLVTPLAYISRTHLYKSLNIIVLFSFVFLSLITVLTTFGYRNDVIELLWYIYRVGILILLLWLATQKTLIFKLLPSAETQFGKLIHRIIAVIYPIFITFVVLLFAIRTLGYPVLSYVLLRTCIKSFIIVFIAFWVWKYLSHRLIHRREKRLKRENLKKDSPEEKRFHTVAAIYHISLNYFISIIAGIIVIRVWVGTFRDALDSPVAPYLVQKISGHTGTILKTIGNGLRHRFFFEEGRYTTPTKIIIALVVLFLSFFIARHTKRLLDEKVFYRLRLDRGLKQTLSTLTRYAIIGIATLIGLSIAGIPLRSLAFFAGAFGIGIGFGMQNIIGNFVSGIILLFERPMRVGDVIALEDGTLGTIDRISARSTTLTTPDEITITVPNSKFVESRITNWTNPSSRMRGSVKVGVVYGSDTALVKKCLLEIARQNPNVNTYPEPFVRFSEFGDSALKFELFFWGDDPGKRWFTMSELNFAIDEVFKKNHIEIAFPQRGIHIRSITPYKNEIVQDLLHEKKDGNG